MATYSHYCDDEQRMILNEDGENFNIAFTSSQTNKLLTVKKVDGKIVFDGDYSLLDRKNIEGILSSLLEKEQEDISKEQMIKNCDLWLQMFNKKHDEFRKKVLTDEYREKEAIMEVSINQVVLADDTFGKSISLDINHYSTASIEEGLSIIIKDENEDIFDYLFVNILKHYLSINYAGTMVSMDEKNKRLYSNDRVDRQTVPIVMNLSSLMNDVKYANIVNVLINNHKFGIPSDIVIDDLRSKVKGQKVSENADCFRQLKLINKKTSQ